MNDRGAQHAQCMSIASEKELDNINDLSSVKSGDTRIMSWPGDERRQDFGESESQFPQAAGSSMPPHHPHKRSKKRKDKDRSRKKERMDMSEGRLSPDSDRWDKSVDPLPEPQTDVPVFSVASTPVDQRARYNSQVSFDKILNDMSLTDSHSGELDASSKVLKHKSSSRERKKKKRLSRQDTRTSTASHISEFSLGSPHTASDLVVANPEPPNSSHSERAVYYSVLTKQGADGDRFKGQSQAATTEFTASPARGGTLNSRPERGRNESESSAFGMKNGDENTSELDDDFMASHTSKELVAEKQAQLAQSRELFNVKHTYTQMSKREISTFIRNTIQQRECSKYKEVCPGMCGCGRNKVWHDDRHLPVDADTNSKWREATHTLTEPCDSFGEIQFRGFGTNVANSPYARLDFQTSPAVAWELMINYWRMPRPRLLISVTGGAQRFELKPRLSNLLKQGLVAAAVNTGAWIITGGTATGVMEFVGEAVRDHMTVSGKGRDEQCVALGIATWGCVANKLALDGEGENGLWPAQYAIEDVINPPKGFSSLDPNHTHFLLVDNGQEGKFGAEITFRSELESYISAVGTTGVSENQVIATPAILIVVEGGINTMETVFQSLKRNTPVVVISGSGRAADFISLGYRLTAIPTDPDKTKFAPDFHNTMTLAANRIFVWKAHDTNKDTKIKSCIDRLKLCLRKRTLINVFNLETSDSAKDIDRAILCALLKANKFNCKSQLALALAWNRCDIARQQIFTPENRSQWEIKDLYDAMFTALVQNRTDFVQLFLDNGVDLKKFLTVKTLWNLYCNCLAVEDDGEASIVRHIMTYMKQGWGAYLRCQGLEEWDDIPKYDMLPYINRVIVHLLKDESFVFYPKEEKYLVRNEKHNMEWKGDNTTIQPLLSRISSQSKGELTGKSSMTLVLKHKGKDPSHSSDSEEDGRQTFARTSHISRSTRIKQKLKRKEHFDFDYPEKDLFIFAVLFNRRHMAALFLKQGTNHIGTALLGSALLRALSDQADMDEETNVSLNLLDHSQQMEHFAKSVLNECYMTNKIDSHKLLTRRIKHLGNTTAILLAERQGLMDFAEHSACQTKLTKIWKGCLAMHTSEFKILLTILMPFLIFLIKFDKSTNTIYTGEATEEQEEEEVEPHQRKMSTASDKRLALTDGTSPRFIPSKNMPVDTTKRTHYKEIRIMACGGAKGINIFKAFYKFYKAPVTKFYFNILAYLIFLGLFSFFLLTDIRPVSEPDSPSSQEYITWIWLFTMLCEEFRQILIGDQRSIRYKVRIWWSNYWNKFDFLLYCGVIVCIILRYQLEEPRFVYVRIFYSIVLAMSYLRLMQYFFAEKNMGPKVLMIRRMLTDLMFFFLILMVFVLSFGIAYHINMFPNAPVSWSILYNVFYFPYFQIYGELFLEDLRGDEVNECTRNETIWREDPMKRCPEENAVVLIMLAVYMLLTNILLVNLLIAMFSYTFQSVQDNSTKLWRFYRIDLVYEYFDRPSLVPPFIILNHIWRAVRWLMHRKFSIKVPKRHNVFRKNLSDEDNLRLTLFEKAAMEVHLAYKTVREREQLDIRVATTADRLEMVMDDLQRIKEAVQLQEMGKETEDDALTADPETARDGVHDTGPVSMAGTPSLDALLNDLKHQTTQNSLRLAEVTSLLEKMVHTKQGQPQ